MCARHSVNSERREGDIIRQQKSWQRGWDLSFEWWEVWVADTGRNSMRNEYTRKILTGELRTSWGQGWVSLQPHTLAPSLLGSLLSQLPSIKEVLLYSWLIHLSTRHAGENSHGWESRFNYFIRFLGFQILVTCEYF